MFQKIKGALSASTIPTAVRSPRAAQKKSTRNRRAERDFKNRARFRSRGNIDFAAGVLMLFALAALALSFAFVADILIDFGAFAFAAVAPAEFCTRCKKSLIGADVSFLSFFRDEPPYCHPCVEKVARANRRRGIYTRTLDDPEGRYPDRRFCNRCEKHIDPPADSVADLTTPAYCHRCKPYVVRRVRAHGFVAVAVAVAVAALAALAAGFGIDAVSALLAVVPLTGERDAKWFAACKKYGLSPLAARYAENPRRPLIWVKSSSDSGENGNRYSYWWDGGYEVPEVVETASCARSFAALGKMVNGARAKGYPAEVELAALRSLSCGECPEYDSGTYANLIDLESGDEFSLRVPDSFLVDIAAQTEENPDADNASGFDSTIRFARSRFLRGFIGVAVAALAALAAAIAGFGIDAASALLAAVPLGVSRSTYARAKKRGDVIEAQSGLTCVLSRGLVYVSGPPEKMEEYCLTPGVGYHPDNFEINSPRCKARVGRALLLCWNNYPPASYFRRLARSRRGWEALLPFGIVDGEGGAVYASSEDLCCHCVYDKSGMGRKGGGFICFDCLRECNADYPTGLQSIARIERGLGAARGGFLSSAAAAACAAIAVVVGVIAAAGFGIDAAAALLSASPLAAARPPKMTEHNLRVAEILEPGEFSVEGFMSYLRALRLPIASYSIAPLVKSLARRYVAEADVVDALVDSDGDFRAVRRATRHRVRRAVDAAAMALRFDPPIDTPPAGPIARYYSPGYYASPASKNSGLTNVAPPLPPRRRQRGFAGFDVALVLSVAAVACAAFMGDFSVLAAALAVAPAAVARAPKKRASRSPRVIHSAAAALVAEGWRPIVIFGNGRENGEFYPVSALYRGDLLADATDTDLLTGAFVFESFDLHSRGLIYMDVFTGECVNYEGPLSGDFIARSMVDNLASRPTKNPPAFAVSEASYVAKKNWYGEHVAIIGARYAVAYPMRAVAATAPTA